MKPCTFQPKTEKQKNPPQENFLCLRKRNPEKTSYIFSKESFFYISETENLKKIFVFQETEVPKKPLIFQELTFRARKIKKPTLKKPLIFQEMELFNPKLKKNSYISGRDFKFPRLNKFLIFF